MELRTRNALKRIRASVPSSIVDRTSTSGSHGEASHLHAFHSSFSAAMKTEQASLASGTHPWNTLCMDLQERILMHLPLQELGRAVCLGKAFRSAGQQRALQVEQDLISAGVTTFGRPLLEGVGQVLQRYRQRTDLATGCGPMLLGQMVWIDRCGSVTLQPPRDRREPRALVMLHYKTGTKDIVEAQNLTLWVTTGPGMISSAGLRLKLSGPTRRSSARLRNEAANLSAEHSHLLGAMFVIAQQVGQEPTSQNIGEPPQHKFEAHPVGPPFPGGGISVQHALGVPGEPMAVNPFDASQASLHPPPGRVGAAAVRRICGLTQPSGTQQVSGELVEQGMITALRLAERFQVPCCRIALQCNVRVFACQNKRYCGKHRVHA